MDILVSRTLYMSCQVGPGIEPGPSALKASALPIELTWQTMCRGCDECCVFCLYCDAWSCRCSCMGSVSDTSCSCCMFVSCVRPVAVLNAAFRMTCSLLMMVEDAIGNHTEE